MLRISMVAVVVGCANPQHATTLPASRAPAPVAQHHADRLATLCDAALAAKKDEAAHEAARIAACDEQPSDEGRDACKAEGPAAIECELSDMEIENVAAPWSRGVVRCENGDGMSVPYHCQPVVLVGDTLLEAPPIASVSDIGAPVTTTVDKAVVVDLLPDPGLELVLTYSAGDRKISTVCEAAPVARCSHAIEGDAIDPKAVTF